MIFVFIHSVYTHAWTVRIDPRRLRVLSIKRIIHSSANDGPSIEHKYIPPHPTVLTKKRTKSRVKRLAKPFRTMAATHRKHVPGKSTESVENKKTYANGIDDELRKDHFPFRIVLRKFVLKKKNASCVSDKSERPIFFYALYFRVRTSVD